MVRLIDADDLKARFLIVANSGGPVVVHVSDICAAIEDAASYESVDAVPVVHGRWFHDWNNLYVCSECGSRETMSPKKLKNYCPSCGAKMDSEG